MNLITLGLAIAALWYRPSIGIKQPGHLLEAATYELLIRPGVIFESPEELPALTNPETWEQRLEQQQRIREIVQDETEMGSVVKWQVIRMERRLGTFSPTYYLLPDQILITPSGLQRLWLEDGQGFEDGALRIRPRIWTFTNCSVRDLGDMGFTSDRWGYAGFYWDGTALLDLDQ